MSQTTAAGTRGFLQWFRQWQPGIYAKIAPELPRKAPHLFSDFEDAGGVAGAQARSLQGLGDAATGLMVPIDLSAATDTTAAVPSVDVADAANNTATDGSTANWLSSLIGGISGAYMTYTQAQNNQAIVNAQLQRAQEGLPPLSIAPGSNGVPTITAGLGGSSNMLLVGGGILAAIGLAYALSGRRR